MRKRALFLVLLSALFASAALAAPQDQETRSLNGRIVACGFNASIPLEGGAFGHIDLYLNPVLLPDGTRDYFARIYWYDGSDHEIFGRLPASIFKLKGVWGPVEVNVTYDAFIDPSGSDHAAFSSLEGTFTVYTGPGSLKMVQTGSRTEVYTHIDGGTETYTLKGINTLQSATFEGMFLTSGGDSYAISMEGPFPLANIQALAGTMRDVITPPPGE